LIKIIGAGMAGLLAANMLRRREPVVYERQKALPHNHAAVLRFRSPLVGEVLGVPFRRVRVIKHAVPWRNPVADAMAYSEKVIGQLRSDRSVLQGTEVVDRWIAPPNLVERMAEGINIKFDTDFDLSEETTKVISTIPMPNLMIMMGYGTPAVFGHLSGTTLRATLSDCDCHVTLYVPDPDSYPYRVSITGNELIVECGHSVPHRILTSVPHTIVHGALHILGLDHSQLASEVTVTTSQYGKIAPIDETVRRDFIHWASTEQGRAFSLGRYATWRPGLLLDDVVNDVRVIERMIDDRYAMDQHRSKS
jgi:hypothetical protein